MQGKEVTVILTSCGRFDLLRRTIESFLLHNTYPIREWWVYEDSEFGVPQDIAKDFPFIHWIGATNTRIGQIDSLDILWRQVSTPYAFTLEDDWEFSAGYFIEASMFILESDPKIMQVWLQPLEEHNVHPIDWNTNTFDGGMVHGQQYGILKGGPTFAGIRFNPSLKRKADYDLIAPFSKHTTWNPEKPWKCEADIAKVYSNLGFKAAILPGRYITHIGQNRHVNP